MDSSQFIEKLLDSFKAYYNVNSENPLSPFCATAEFHSHNEQFFLVKAAKIADIDANDYAYFYYTSSLNSDSILQITDQAWTDGLSKVKPAPSHHNSDVTVILLADKIDDEAKKQIKKIKYYKSYKFTFWGWSHFRLIAAELSTGRLFYNRFGSDLKKTLSNIFKSFKGESKK